MLKKHSMLEFALNQSSYSHRNNFVSYDQILIFYLPVRERVLRWDSIFGFPGSAKILQQCNNVQCLLIKLRLLVSMVTWAVQLSWNYLKQWFSGRDKWQALFRFIWPIAKKDSTITFWGIKRDEQKSMSFCLNWKLRYILRGLPDT